VILSSVSAPSVAICPGGIRAISSTNPLALLNFPVPPSQIFMT